MSRQTPEQQLEASSQPRHQSTMVSGQHRNVPELSATNNTYTLTNNSNTTDRGTSCPAARESPAAEHQQPDRSVRFENTSYLHNTPTATHTYAEQQSTLVPYDDVRTARYSLPEFHGTTPEDPVRFIHKAESILYQTHIDRSGWTNIIESHHEFRAEFLEKFDNADIQSRLRAEIVSVRQDNTQSLTEFVIQKNQLARRINTGLPEPQLVSTITGLTRDEYRTHILLQRPATFADLRRIAGILDYTPDLQSAQQQPRRENKKNGPTRAPRPTYQPRTQDGTAEKLPPPNPCKYCGGHHWNSDCPGYTAAPGNGN